jgi:enolase
VLFLLHRLLAAVGSVGTGSTCPENGENRLLTIEELSAVEILDSRAHPTLAVTVGLSGDVTARAGVPSGASTGSREARELRDGDSSRFEGLGVRTAVGHVNGEIAAALRGRTFVDLADVDAALIDLDGTPDKARLGANAIVGVSMATARAVAVGTGMPLWWSLTPAGIRPRLPVPHFNVVNGGVHAPNRLDFNPGIRAVQFKQAKLVERGDDLARAQRESRGLISCRHPSPPQ